MQGDTRHCRDLHIEEVSRIHSLGGSVLQTSRANPTKKPEDPPDKYVAAFAGSDIETNPPATNEAVANLDRQFTRQVDQLPPPEILEEIDRHVDMAHLERTLMEEGLAKFADPQKALIALIGRKREELTGA